MASCGTWRCSAGHVAGPVPIQHWLGAGSTVFAGSCPCWPLRQHEPIPMLAAIAPGLLPYTMRHAPGFGVPCMWHKEAPYCALTCLGLGASQPPGYMKTAHRLRCKTPAETVLQWTPHAHASKSCLSRRTCARGGEQAPSPAQVQQVLERLLAVFKALLPSCQRHQHWRQRQRCHRTIGGGKAAGPGYSVRWRRSSWAGQVLRPGQGLHCV